MRANSVKTLSTPFVDRTISVLVAVRTQALTRVLEHNFDKALQR